jgi:hypothetical protein
MKTTLLHTVTIAAALLFLSGMLYEVPAGQRHRTVTRNPEVTSVPAPVVDDSPINPDTAGKIKPRDNRGNVPFDRQPPKRRMIRR